MRDHRRRAEIRLLAVRDWAEAMASNLKVDRRRFLANANGHWPMTASFYLLRITNLLTDGGGTGEFPAEFKRANPRIPWSAITDLHDQLCGATQGSRVRREPTRKQLWAWTKIRIPRVVRLLERPNSPKRWCTEPHGELGISDILNPHRTGVRRLMKRFGVKRLRVCGSVARGEADGRSDVDLLADFDRRYRTDTVGLAIELAHLIGRRVSVFTEGTTYPPLRQRILSEAVTFA
jgi:hypothetical protein